MAAATARVPEHARSGASPSASAVRRHPAGTSVSSHARRPAPAAAAVGASDVVCASVHPSSSHTTARAACIHHRGSVGRCAARPLMSLAERVGCSTPGEPSGVHTLCSYNNIRFVRRRDRFRGVTVSTQDSESCDPGSNPGGTCPPSRFETIWRSPHRGRNTAQHFLFLHNIFCFCTQAFRLLNIFCFCTRVFRLPHQRRKLALGQLETQGLPCRPCSPVSGATIAISSDV